MAEGNIELVIRARNETTGAISEAKADITSLSKAAEDAQKAILPGTDINKQITLSAKDNATPVLNQVTGTLGGVDDAAAATTNAMGGLNAALALGAASVGIAGIVQLTQAIWDLGESGAAFQELQDASFALGESFGVNARQMLARMREAADGTISDSALMLAANKAIVQGVTTNAETMASLLEEARARADAFGLGSAEAFNILITGIGNAAPRMLKQLGYTISLSDANEAYARSIGKTADALTEQESRTAILQAVQAQSGKIPSIDSAADSFERLDAALTNLKDALGVLFGPAVAAIAQGLADAANGANEIIKGASSELASGAIVAGEEITRLQLRLQELEANKAQLTQGAIGTGRTADTSAIDAEITAAQQAASAYVLLRNTTELANQAMQDGVPNAGQYVAQINAIVASVEQNRTITNAQIGELANLNAALQGAASATAELAGQQAGAVGPMGGLNAAIDAQTGKMLALWQAAAGALGAQAAWDGYQASVEDATQATKDWANAAVLGSNVPLTFALQEQLADTQEEIKGLQDTAQEPIRLNVAIESTANAAAQKAYSEAIKAGQDTAAAAQLANNAAIQTTDEVRRQVEAWQAAGFSAGTIANVLLPGMRSQLTATNNGISEMEKAFDRVKGAASGILENALNVGVGVDPNDILGQLGLRPDAINENARRLADIAKNGLKDQDWLPAFKQSAPEAWAELMFSSRMGTDIKAAAARMLLDFQDGLRPDLLDREKAKDLVRRAIIGDANTAAMAAEIAAELSSEMGIALQTAQAAAQSTLGVDTGAEGGTGQTLTITPVVAFGEGAAEEAAKLGQTIADGLGSEASLKALMNAGKSAAGTWGNAFLGAVGEAVPPELIDMLTSLVTPQVKAQLGGLATQTGAVP